MYCSFCGKDQDQVKVILTGPCVYICDECVFLCVDILNTEFNTPYPEIDSKYKAAWEFLKGHLEWIQRNPYYPWLKEFSEAAIARCESEILDPDYNPNDSY